MPSTSTWSVCVKSDVKLAVSLLRVVPLVFGQLTRSNVKVVWGFAQNVRRLHLRMGPRGLALYLKACGVLLQHAAGGMVNLSTWDLGAAVSRTRRGIPRIINPLQRAKILSGDQATIRLWLTLFGLYRVIEFKGALKLRTISDPGVDLTLFMEDWEKWIPVFFDKIRSITGDSWKMELRGKRGLTPSSIPLMQKCSPNSRGFTSVMGILWDILLLGSHPGMHDAVKQWLSAVDGVELTWAFNGILKVMDAWIQLRWSSRFEMMRVDLSSGRCHRGSPLAMVVNWQSGMGTTSGTLHPLLPWAGDPVYLYRHWYLDHYWRKPLWFGRLAFLQEPGKIRVVAMVSLIIQTLMYPLHEWIFARLRLIPTDGTFDQTAPVERLIEGFTNKGHWTASYDLSAATDRLPVAIQVALLEPLLGKKLANLWAYLLVSQPYGLPRISKSYHVGTDRLWYAVGQPMGALSSWAMLALTHHAIVQLAASKAYSKAGWFLLYAVLGDDVVIADRLVAKEYLRIMEQLGVGIGLAKSLVSNQNSIEFAKRTWIRGQDCSPVSLAEVKVAQCNLGSLGELVRKCKKFGVIRFSSVGLFLGFKYRNLAQLPVGLGVGNRLSRVLAYLCRPGGVWPMPFEAWLASVAPGGTDSDIKPLRQWVTAVELWRDILGSLLRRSSKISKMLFEVTTFSVTEATYPKKVKEAEGAGGALASGTSRSPDLAESKTDKAREPFFSESLVEFWNLEVLGPQLNEFFKEWITYPYQLKLRRRFEKIDDTLRVLDPGILPEWGGLEELWKQVVEAEEGIDSLPSVVEMVSRENDAKPPSTSLINLWKRLRTLATSESKPFTDVRAGFSVRRMPKRRRASA